MAKRDIELAVSPEAGFFILEKAREFDEKTPPINSPDGSNPSDDGGVEVLEAFRDDPAYVELVAAIRGLDEDSQVDLVALMWLGRGDFTLDEWDDCRRLARERRSTPTAQYIAGTPLASDYLEEGLALLGYRMDESATGRRF